MVHKVFFLFEKDILKIATFAAAIKNENAEDCFSIYINVDGVVCMGTI